MICREYPASGSQEAHYYCEIIEMAKSHGVKTLLDTDGDAMQHALEGKPTVIMLNQHKAERAAPAAP